MSSNTTNRQSDGIMFYPLWRHRSLLWQFAKRYVNVRHKGSYLGILWQVLTPLLMLALYTFVFGILLHGHFGAIENETSADYALGIFLGFTLYGLVADCMGAAPNVVFDNSNLVKKVLFPVEVLPASMALSMCYSFVISMGLFVVGYVFFGPAPTLHALWFPVILLPLFLLAVGLAWLIGGLGVYFRDVQNVMQFLTTALFYISGIFFSASSANAGTKARVALDVLRWNPIFLAIDLSRDVTLWGKAPDYGEMAYLYGVCICVFVAGYALFMRLKAGFADVM
jgi:lipopolysaccharide transport system permease protein